MRILIDTHYVIWAALHPETMEPWAREMMIDLNNEVIVSAASLYEISLKVRKGKLPEAVPFESDLVKNIESLGYSVLPLEPEVIVRAARFEDLHTDPFDRMIAAHAIQHNLPVLSIDDKLDAFGVRRIRNPAQRRGDR
jgi:PIN domain nuclease of toxin-antitoxin system